jgi:Protein of unknown function with HXXEE motif
MNGYKPRISTGLWLALFPITYAMHFAEELFCGEGYPAYLFRLRGVELSTTRFVTLQTIGFALITAGCFISRIQGWGEFCALVLSGVVFSNGLSHTITAIWDGGYGPGLIVSAFVWLPLGVLTFFVMFPRITRIQFVIAMLIGLTISGVVALLALRGGQFS